jgi:hypothetical protein
VRISEAIQRLTTLREQHGDVDVVTDCAHCGQSTTPTTIVTGPPVVRLRGAAAEPEEGHR